MTEKLFVSFTMDAERIAGKCPTGGPPSWEFAEKSVRDYCGLLGSRGYPVTFFILPDTAEQQSSLFRDVARDGHECAMHFHAQSWRDNYLSPDDWQYLGGYPPDVQEPILRDARDQWADAIGHMPAAFRPGNCSANDATYGILESLGFTCGSVSIPGRCKASFYAIWTDADRTVHRANHAFRMVAGDLDFVEVPITTDCRVTDHWSGTGDVRFETAEVPAIVAGATDHLQAQVDARSRIKHLCLFTHNSVCYDPKEAENRANVLLGVMEQLPDIAAQFGLEPEGCTVSGMRTAFLSAEK